MRDLSLILAAILATCCPPATPRPADPCQIDKSDCYLSPACIEDALGAPPLACGIPCGDGLCDGAGACCL